MTDRVRIEQMAAEGRITRAEAERLIAVLDELDGLDEDLDAVEGDAFVAAGETQPASDFTRPASPVDTAAGQQAAGAATTTAVMGSTQRPGDATTGEQNATSFGEGKELPWLEVDLFFGDIEVRVDESASEPSVSSDGAGHINLERTERGFRLTGTGDGEASILDRVLGNLRRGGTTVVLPAGYGLRLQMKAADIDIRGPLAALSGKIAASNLEADEIRSIDLSVSAGDIDLGLRLAGGNHRLKAAAGDINLRLLKGTDVTVRGSLSVGEFSAPAGWHLDRRGLGSTVEQKVGNGSGTFDLEIGTGDLDIELANG